MTFVEQCLQGMADPSQIDDFIDQWHEGPSQQSLHDYLGFTAKEYACWVEEPLALRAIFFARKTHTALEECLEWVLADNVAARAKILEEAEAEVLRNWLERTGRIPR